jgi:hypothetical protein
MASESPFKELVAQVCVIWEKDRISANLPKSFSPKTFPPAVKRDIAALEKKLGCTLPDEYREFLAVTNGMLGFSGVFAVVGAEQKETEKALKDIAKFKSCWTKEWESNNGEANDVSIAKYESKMNLKKTTEDEARIFVGNKLIFATDFSGRVYFFLSPPKAPSSTALPLVVRRSESGEIRIKNSLRDVLEGFVRVGALSDRKG